MTSDTLLARTPSALFILAITAGILLVGCSSVQSRTDPPHSQGLLYPAEQLLIAHCMAANGLTYEPDLIPPASPQQMFPYGIDDTHWAREHGFGRSLIASHQTAELGMAPNSEADRYALALNGTGPDGPGVTVRIPTGQTVGHSTRGCAAYAEGVLYGSFSSWFKIDMTYEDLAQLAQQSVERTDAYAVALSKWSDCMSRSGYSFASPIDAMNYYLTSNPPPSNTAAARAAVTESRCMSLAGMPQLARRLTAAALKSIDQHYRHVITAYEMARKRAAYRAHQVIKTLCKGGINSAASSVCRRILKR